MTSAVHLPNRGFGFKIFCNLDNDDLKIASARWFVGTSFVKEQKFNLAWVTHQVRSPRGGWRRCRNPIGSMANGLNLPLAAWFLYLFPLNPFESFWKRTEVLQRYQFATENINYSLVPVVRWTVNFHFNSDGDLLRSTCTG